MKTLYFDCFSGISGDMTVGALLDLGIVSTDELLQELKKLNINDEFYIEVNRVDKNAIFATDFDVHVKEHHHHHHHDDEQIHTHEHHHGRTMHDIEHIILHSDLSDKTKEITLKIFGKIAIAEAQVHNKSVSDVHFHEVGAVDSIIDIVSVAVLIDKMGIQRIICSMVNEGRGFVNCQHGLMPVPVPAVSAMFAERGVPVKNIDVEAELVTPTGAGVICAMVDAFVKKPTMENAVIGYGAGKKNFKTPNLLRVYLGDSENSGENMIVIETNVDDMTGEALGYLMEVLLENGASDAFFTPIYMKKNRPAVKISVICAENKLSCMKDVLFMHSSTIGMRYYSVEREVLERKIITVATPFGNANVKECICNGEKKSAAEYEDVRIIAKKSGLSFATAREIIMNSYEKIDGNHM